jgi:hypothetical protein
VIISAINSKDAVCLALTGRTSKGDNHADAVAELKRAGSAGADLSPTVNRLLKLKRVEWAQRMFTGAQDVVAGR